MPKQSAKNVPKSTPDISKIFHKIRREMAPNQVLNSSKMYL